MKKTALAVFISILAAFFFIKPYFNNPELPVKKTIKFSSWGSQIETEILKKLISEYENENTGIKIDFIHIPQNYFQKIQLLFASNLEPDVVFINNQNIRMYIEAGLLEDITQYFPLASDTFYPQSLDALSKDGKLYAIPRDISNLVIFYNKDLFNKAGIKNPKTESLNDLKELCEKIKQLNVYAINCEENPLYWLNFLAANGGGALSDDAKSVILNRKESLEAADLYVSFINKYHYAPTKADMGSMTAAQMFISGKLAMYISGRWSVPKLRETAGFDWDILPFPGNSENKVYIDVSGWAITKKSKNKSEAADFIKYLSSEKSSESFAASGLIIPARIDVSHSSSFLETSQKPYSSYIFTESLKYSKPTPLNENYSKIYNLLKERMRIMTETKINAEKGFDEKTITKTEKLLNR